MEALRAMKERILISNPSSQVPQRTAAGSRGSSLCRNQVLRHLLSIKSSQSQGGQYENEMVYCDSCVLFLFLEQSLK